MKTSLSIKVYIGLVLTLSVLAAVSVFLPTFQGMVPTGEMPASQPVLAAVNAVMVLVIYGGLGFIGLKLARKLGFPDIWDPSVTNRQRFLVPALAGIGVGVFLIILDAVFSRFHTLGPIPHPAFPASIIGSLSAGIGEELLFRLFFIPFWVWIASRIILKGRWQNPVFWIVTVFSALAFAFGHLPTAMLLYNLKSISEIPAALLAEIILLNGAISVLAAYYFKKYGYLAPVGVHFWADVVWHVIWGLF